MRSITALVIVAVGLAGSLGGCVPQGRSVTPGEVINLETGQTCRLTLESNPTTGYGWSVTYDETIVELLRQEYEPRSNLLGAPGVEVFTFRALGQGRTDAVFRYRRTWEEEAIRTEAISFVVR